MVIKSLKYIRMYYGGSYDSNIIVLIAPTNISYMIVVFLVQQ